MKLNIFLLLVIVVLLWALSLLNQDLKSLQMGISTKQVEGKLPYKIVKVFPDKQSAWKDYQALKRAGLNPVWEVK